jgi:hypothetical protein
MDRLVAPRRERPISLQLPSITKASDLIAATGTIATAVADGEITPGEASALSAVVAHVGKVIELADISARLDAIAATITPKAAT